MEIKFEENSNNLIRDENQISILDKNNKTNNEWIQNIIKFLK